MKTYRTLIVICLLVGGAGTFTLYSFKNSRPLSDLEEPPTQGCVFKTVFEAEAVDSSFYLPLPEDAERSIDQGLKWIVAAQHENGGWGAGSHHRQNIMDPHAVKTDPATTAMVAMALLRTGSDLNNGMYTNELRDATTYLLATVENSSEGAENITQLSGTQIQTKLGANIDVIMTSQFFGNLIDYLDQNELMYAKVQQSLQRCTRMIENAVNEDGEVAGAGWAGVLQSAMANNALEAAKSKGIVVDSVVLENSKQNQEKNFNSETGEINAEKGAGVMLYSISGSVRSAAKDARKIEREVKNAKSEGRLNEEDEINPENLEKLGYDRDNAMKYSTTFQVFKSGKEIAQRDDIVKGFGNDGGEEFLSFLQTGESMIIGKDQDWKKWYDKVYSRLVSIQNNDGSWNGHHCITSPVFCTATCLLILSVNNDLEQLVALGASDDMTD